MATEVSFWWLSWNICINRVSFSLPVLNLKNEGDVSVKAVGPQSPT